MNSRERVLEALDHKIPDRIPAHVICIDDCEPYLEYLGCKDIEALYEYFGMDIRWINTTYKRADTGKNHFGTSGGLTDYSESTFLRPLATAETISDVSAYSWPDVTDFDYDTLLHGSERYHKDYAVMVCGWNPIFCQVLDLFGMEHTLYQLCMNPLVIETAVSHIEDFYLKYYKVVFETIKGKADIFNIGDDFATQRGMMISPDMWRKFFKPTYKRIFEMAKNYGLYVWFYSCGAISEVLPDLIDIGMDVWETVQAHLPGNEPEWIKKEYGKDISFFGAINTQLTLPYGTPEQVRDEVRERIKFLGRDGGYICGPDHHINPGIPIENVCAMYDEIRNFRYKGCTL